MQYLLAALTLIMTVAGCGGERGDAEILLAANETSILAISVESPAGGSEGNEAKPVQSYRYTEKHHGAAGPQGTLVVNVRVLNTLGCPSPVKGFYQGDRVHEGGFGVPRRSGTVGGVPFQDFSVSFAVDASFTGGSFWTEVVCTGGLRVQDAFFYVRPVGGSCFSDKGDSVCGTTKPSADLCFCNESCAPGDCCKDHGSCGVSLHAP